MNSPDTDSTTVAVDEKEYILNAVLPNFELWVAALTGLNHRF